MTNISIVKLSGAFHCVKTSRMRFWAFSYSTGDPCDRSDQLIMYFIVILRCSAEVLFRSCSAALRDCRGSRMWDLPVLPAGLRPEGIPGVEIKEVLLAGYHPAVPDLEDDAAGDIEVLAVALTDIAMHAHHAPLAIREHVAQLRLEAPAGLGAIAAEMGEDSVPALAQAGHRRTSRCLPRGVLV